MIRGVDTTAAAAPVPVTTAELEAKLAWIGAAPADVGRLELIVRRPAIDEREVLAEGVLDLEVGLVGDNWPSKPSTSNPDGGPNPDRQLTLMNARIAALVARSPERMALAGDQLYVDFDLSVANAPAGTGLGIGTAVIELTEPPHLGCEKFVSRFGREAMRFVNSAVGRSLRLRGANAKVVSGGVVRVGDPITRLA
jgi:MOSC domain-containing protein YiiM